MNAPVTLPARIVPTTVEIAPCPFCLAEPGLHRSADGKFSIICENEECPVTVEGHAQSSIAEAARLWNHRWFPGFIKPERAA